MRAGRQWRGSRFAWDVMIVCGRRLGTAWLDTAQVAMTALAGHMHVAGAGTKPSLGIQPACRSSVGKSNRCGLRRTRAQGPRASQANVRRKGDDNDIRNSYRPAAGAWNRGHDLTSTRTVGSPRGRTGRLGHLPATRRTGPGDWAGCSYRWYCAGEERKREGRVNAQMSSLHCE